MANYIAATFGEKIVGPNTTPNHADYGKSKGFGQALSIKYGISVERQKGLLGQGHGERNWEVFEIEQHSGSVDMLYIDAAVRGIEGTFTLAITRIAQEGGKENLVAKIIGEQAKVIGVATRTGKTEAGEQTAITTIQLAARVIKGEAADDESGQHAFEDNTKKR